MLHIIAANGMPHSIYDSLAANYDHYRIDFDSWFVLLFTLSLFLI